MADNKKQKRIEITSPKGVFKWPKLSAPDYGTKEYPCPEGKYEVKLVLQADDPATKKFLAALKPHHEAAIEEGKKEFAALPAQVRKKIGELKVNDVGTEVIDNETEQPTGEIEFKFGMAASGEIKKGPKAGQKWSRKPVIFDAKGNAMVKVPDIYGGTVGRIRFEVRPYFIKGTGTAGLKLALVAAQVIDLVSGGQRSASQCGFEEEEGYEYSEADAAAEEKTDAAAGTDDSADDEAGNF